MSCDTVTFNMLNFNVIEKYSDNMPGAVWVNENAAAAAGVTGSSTDLSKTIMFNEGDTGTAHNASGILDNFIIVDAGFPEKTADIRMAQYESGSRTPKTDLTNKLAEVFDISPQALSVPDIDSYIGLMHTLFTLEDRYGLTIIKTENGVSMYADPRKGTDATELSKMLNAWAEQSEKYHNGDINRDEYDKWRYNYPKYDETSGFVKVPSQNLSNAMVEAFKDRLKND